MAKNMKHGKNYKSKETVIWDGKKAGTTLYYEDGYQKTLLNPHGKGSKYAQELKAGVGFTVDGEVKTGKDGFVKELTNEQKAYRSGYLAAQKDNANAYKAKRK